MTPWWASLLAPSLPVLIGYLANRRLLREQDRKRDSTRRDATEIRELRADRERLHRLLCDRRSSDASTDTGPFHTYNPHKP